MPIFGFPGVPRWADFVSFCSIDCTPVWTGLEEVTASPFHVVLQGPLSGPIDLYAGGALYVTTAPIPAPGSRALLALGLAALARRRPPLG